VPDSGAAPVELVVAQEHFAGAPFWAAAGRLADRLGHGDHPSTLLGQIEPTDRYRLCCLRCGQVLAVFTVLRNPVSPDPEVGAAQA
jgi:hypothetical protein